MATANEKTGNIENTPFGSFSFQELREANRKIDENQRKIDLEEEGIRLGKQQEILKAEQAKAATHAPKDSVKPAKAPTTKEAK